MKLIHKKRFLQGFIKIDLFVKPLCKYILNKRLSFSSGILMMKFLHLAYSVSALWNASNIKEGE